MSKMEIIEANGGADTLPFEGAGLYVTYTSQQYDGSYASKTVFWQTIEDYQKNGISDNHGGTPWLLHSPSEWNDKMA